MNKYLVRVQDFETSDSYDIPTKLETIEADSFVITANGDLKFNLKQGGSVEAYSQGVWKQVRRIEDSEDTPPDDANTQENQEDTNN